MPDLASDLRGYVDRASTITLDEVSRGARPRPRRSRRTLAVAAVCCCVAAVAIAVAATRIPGRRHGAPMVSVTPTSTVTTGSSVAPVASVDTFADLNLLR